MKSLVESLFDKDITTKEHPYEELLKSRITIKDISNVVFNSDFGENSSAPIKNKLLQKWSEKWKDEIKPGQLPLLYCKFGRYCVWDSKDAQIKKESENYLKLNKIHTEVHFNDAMHANTFDIPWSFWGIEKKWNDITEWIAWKYKAEWGNYVMILINRKDYDEWDQRVIHKMIEIISKKGSR